MNLPIILLMELELTLTPDFCSRRFVSACYPQHHHCIASRFPKLKGRLNVTITERVLIAHQKE